MPNDNYVVDEGHRTFAYIVPADAKVTVLTNKGDPQQLGATPVTVAELAKIVDGTSDVELYEPLDTGVWITVEATRCARSISSTGRERASGSDRRSGGERITSSITCRGSSMGGLRGSTCCTPVSTGRNEAPRRPDCSGRRSVCSA